MSELYGQGWFGSCGGVKEWSEKEVEDSIPTWVTHKIRQKFIRATPHLTKLVRMS